MVVVLRSGLHVLITMAPSRPSRRGGCVLKTVADVRSGCFPTLMAVQKAPLCLKGVELRGI